MARVAARRGAKAPSIELRRPSTDGDLASTVVIFREYAASLDVDLCFQNFDAELASLPGEYAPPAGQLLLAFVDGALAGCGALRRFADADDANACEMKRLYVSPPGRGLGLGRALVDAIIREAERIGYHEMRLDSLPTMVEAIALYRKTGFVPIEPYYDTPVAGTVFLSRPLSA